MSFCRIVSPLPLAALCCLLSLACGGETKAPAALAYWTNPATYTKGAAIPANAPTVAGGPVASYSVSPALPPGLVLDAATGVISGTPTALAPTASHLVTAANAGGTATARLTVTVNDVAPSGLAYATSAAVYLKGVAIAPNAPSSAGGAVTAYEVSPPLPAGLSLDATTGVITGTPAETVPSSSHLVTAHNSGGSTATILTITVSTLAERSGPVVSGELATTTPFARHLLLSGTGFDQLLSAQFEVEPRPGAVSRPLSVTFQRSHLDRRGLVVSDRQLRLPVFGLHAGRTNMVSVSLTYTDGSVRRLWTGVAADPYVDPTGVYASPTIRTARQAGDGLGFDYFWIKSLLGPPVVLDSDGSIRWAVPPASLHSASSAVYDGAFVVGNGMQLTRFEFDGAASSSQVGDPRYSAFHHDMGPGKVGLLVMVDGTSTTGASRIETILAELGPGGEVLREWDMADIFRQEMTAAGDDPADFVRDGVDWFHMNSAVYLPEDDALLVSGRESFVVKLDYATGAITWLFGDPTKHWYVNYPSLRRLAVTLPAGLYPIGQHAVSSPVPGELLLFNNGKNSLNQPAGAPAGEDRTFSAVSRYRIDDTLRTAEEVFSYEAGRSILSMYCSSVFEARPGHYFITYSMAHGTTTKLVGLLPDGAKAFDLEFATNFCSSGWNARPIELERFELR